jgi:hypothetical protein
MASTAQARTPVHVWIVGLLSLLWNCFGAYDYLMTRTHNMEYLKTAMPGVDPKVGLAWVESMPMYAQFGWGLGVWFALLGSILLLIRSRWAAWSFGVSLVGALLSLGYQLLLAPPMPGATESPAMKIMPLFIIAVAIGLFLYARAMEKRGVLR